jgi:prepilin-type N-terminal cleavage/methylation domain-containing protein
MASLIHFLTFHIMQRMASQIFFIPRGKHRSNRAFTLVEILVCAAISSIIIAGVLSTFLTMGRISANVQNYSEIEADARKALEIMSREMHLAFNVENYSANSVTLTLPDSAGNTPSLATTGSPPLPAPPFYNQQSTQGSPLTLASLAYSVTYAYDSTNKRITRSVNPASNDPYANTFELIGGVPTMATNVEQVAGTNVFNYYRYVTPTATAPGQGYANQYNGNNVTGYSSPSSIQQIEVKFFIKRKSVTVTSATNKVLSARFILRNKR